MSEPQPIDTPSVEKPTSATASSNDEDTTIKYTKEDLIELIRAIKFSQPDASIRTVHTEITTKMSQNDSFEFLEQVKLNDVKKVWKKAITGGGGSGNNNNNGNSSNGDSNAMVRRMLREEKNNENEVKTTNTNNKSSKENNEILKFYTVGDGSVQTLAKNYTLQAAANALAEEENAFLEQNEIMKKYVSCFLDVPADRSGGKPHQALINFNDHKGNGKKDSKSSKKDGDGREIVKIQVAASLPGYENTPMLLYNLDRTAKTFIHHEEDDESKGYEKIKEMITSHGSSGALKGGGTKAYFYSLITRRKGEKDLISIDTSELAPTQKW